MKSRLDKILNISVILALVFVVVKGLLKTDVAVKDDSKDPSESIIFDTVMAKLPEAVSLSYFDTSYYNVMDGSGAIVGMVLLSEPYSSEYKGFAGRTPLQIVMTPDGRIADVEILENRETPNYIRHLRSEGYFESWDGLTVEEVLSSDVDAVSGATMSSVSIQNSLKARLSILSRQGGVEESTFDWHDFMKRFCVVVVLVLALICFFNPSRTKRLRVVTLILSILIIGFWQNALLSTALLWGWLTSGIAWQLQWAMVLLAVLALVTPLFFRKAFYCTYVCPMGALQELSSKCTKHKVNIPHKVLVVLLVVRKVILLALLLLLVIGVGIDLGLVEPFSAFSWRSISWGMIVFALVVVLSSLFVNKAWCRFLCPTGTLLDCIRTLLPAKKSSVKN